MCSSASPLLLSTPTIIATTAGAARPVRHVVVRHDAVVVVRSEYERRLGVVGA